MAKDLVMICLEMRNLGNQLREKAEAAQREWISFRSLAEYLEEHKDAESDVRNLETRKTELQAEIAALEEKKETAQRQFNQWSSELSSVRDQYETVKKRWDEFTAKHFPGSARVAG